MRNIVTNGQLTAGDQSGPSFPSRHERSPEAAVPSHGMGGRPVLLILGAIGLVAMVSGIQLLAGGSPARGDQGPGSAASLLAVLSLIATTGYLAIFLTLHVLPTGFNPVRHAVSDYAVSRYGSLFRVGLCVSSVGVLALAFALLRGVGSPPLAARDLIYLLLIPLTRIGMALFPTSLEGRRVSRTGYLHYGFAIAAFTFTYLAISETTGVLRGVDPGTWLRTPLRWTAWAVAPELTLVVITMLRPLRKIFGLFERLFLLTTNVWFVLVAIELLARLR